MKCYRLSKAFQRCAHSSICIAPISHSSRFVATSSFSVEETLNSPEKLLLTPGPLSTSPTVKAVMCRDFGSRDKKFIELIQSVRQGILDTAGLDNKEFTSILMQGSGTFSVEAAITSSVPRENGRLLVIANGAYGMRAAKIAQVAGIDVECLSYLEDEKPNATDVDKIMSVAVSDNKPFSNVIMIHSETTSGLINDIDAVGKVVANYTTSDGNKPCFIIDAMSSFGAVPTDFHSSGIDILVTSANKCLQGVPGFGVVIARRALLQSCQGYSRSLSLDIFEQWKGLEKDGQFRFTPPTHTIMAFRKALDELAEEGGISARRQRYQTNKAIIVEAIERLGFEQYLSPNDRDGYIITSIKYPTSPNWDFTQFYNRLAEKDFLIYPGKVTNADCFRIGHIGHIYPDDCRRLVKCLEQVCQDMQIFANK